MDSGRAAFCPFCGQHMRRLTRFSFSCGRSLECLNRADQTEGLDVLQQCTLYFHEGHSYAAIVDMMSCLHDVQISLRSLKGKLNDAGVSVQMVTVLTGDHSPNASLVVVATPAVGNRDQTRSCPCECLFDLFSIKRQKDTRLIGIWSLIGGTCHIEPF